MPSRTSATLETVPSRPQLYYITDRKAFPGDEPSRQRCLLQKIAEATRAGIDYIQLREKDLPARELEQLAREAIRIVREVQSPFKTRNLELETKLLINSRTDIALAVCADGVHLRSDDISPADVRAIQSAASRNWGEETRNLIVGVSCRSAEDVRRAAHEGATLAVLAPVFGKVTQGRDAPQIQPLGTDALKAACQSSLPVFALGGVTLANAQACLNAGAKGIAGIRLFQENNIEEVARELRS